MIWKNLPPPTETWKASGVLLSEYLYGNRRPNLVKARGSGGSQTQTTPINLRSTLIIYILVILGDYCCKNGNWKAGDWKKRSWSSGPEWVVEQFAFAFLPNFYVEEQNYALIPPRLGKWASCLVGRQANAYTCGIQKWPRLFWKINDFQWISWSPLRGAIV